MLLQRMPPVISRVRPPRSPLVITSPVPSYSWPQVSVGELKFVARSEWRKSSPRREFSDNQAGGEQKVSQVVQDSSAGAFQATFSTLSSATRPTLRTERLWHEYLTDPYQQWDKRKNTINLKAPDFRHESTRESMWIDGWHNPGGVVIDMLEKKEAEKWGISGGKSSDGHAKQQQEYSISEDPVLAEELAYSGRMCRASYRSAVQVDSSESKKLRKGSRWEMLSLEEAFNIIDRMAELPSVDKFICILQKCRKNKNLAYAKRMHAHICNKGLEAHKTLGNYIVPMFVECGSMSDAQQVFNRLVHRTEHSWTSLILGYIQCGQSQQALNLYQKMQQDNVLPSKYTLMALLKAYARLKDVERGRDVHVEIVQKGFDTDIFVGSTLVDMYAKCGSISEAREVFDKVPVRNVVSWNALIAGYAEHGPGQEALKCFEQMQLKGISPDTITFVCILKACGSIGAIEKGREIHMEIAHKGFERDIFVGSTLVDMYSKCGSLSEAREVFDELPVRNVVSWSAMINGYGMNHEGNMAIRCFEDMQGQGVKPNAITFTCLLTACSRAGLVFKGQEYFQAMRKEYGVVPTTDHYTCMVDLLARSGHLYEAEKFLETMPCAPSIETLTALLSACKTYGETELGLRCFQQLVRMNPEIAASYVLMANIYANAGRRDDAYGIEELRKLARAKKKSASALIEVNKKVHEFVVGNNQSKEISAMLEVLSSRMEEEGHVPNLDMVLRPIPDEKEAALCEHAEKLALAFGFLNTPNGQTLHVTKNMRMCNNCHYANKIISRTEKRVIIVRDSYCIHHFKDGLCSCGGLF